VAYQEDDESDAEDVEHPNVSCSEAQAVLERIHLFVLQSKDAAEEITHVQKLEKLVARRSKESLLQPSLLNFFNKM
jgi:hypothetical protein